MKNSISYSFPLRLDRRPDPTPRPEVARPWQLPQIDSPRGIELPRRELSPLPERILNVPSAQGTVQIKGLDLRAVKLLSAEEIKEKQQAVVETHLWNELTEKMGKTAEGWVCLDAQASHGAGEFVQQGENNRAGVHWHVPADYPHDLIDGDKMETWCKEKGLDVKTLSM